jgi:hypothetical protein
MDDEVPSLVSQDLDDLAPELAPIDITVEHKSKVPITVITGFLGSGKVGKPEGIASQAVSKVNSS